MFGCRSCPVLVDINMLGKGLNTGLSAHGTGQVAFVADNEALIQYTPD